jgi:orotate phosphoribosyltransferase/AMMECR1 domain-containing protein
MEAWSETIARLPASFHADRDELLALMRKEAILHESPSQPVLSRDGSTARWILNSLQVTMTARGAELAGRCILELLKGFEGRQLATLGLTAVPILNACIARSGGRYHGLLVRKERKQHGSLKLIEGPIDRDEPTILIDDSISSGMSMQQACNTLREAGIRVEGGVCLVRFGWYGGYARMQEQGYRVAAVSDIWTDFMYYMEDEPKPIGNPTKLFPKFEWSGAQAPENLHPAELARIALREFITSGTLPRPPQRLDGDYPAEGGAWVSLRSRQDIHLRHARDGFWHFPGEETWTAPEAVIRAASKTAATLPQEEALALLDDSAIAVTFFTALTPCRVGELDNDRYGIVVRSLERPGWMGGALPRMPGILNEWDQYQHARITNAGLASFEPHEILRHDVVKAVEPETVWQKSGVPATGAPSALTEHRIGGAVAARARDLALARIFGTARTTAPLPSSLLPADVDSLYVSIYIGGRLRGCFGTELKNLDADVASLVEHALQDTRFENGEVTSPGAVAASVSILHDRLDLGIHSVEDVVRRIRFGVHALMAVQGNRYAVYLPSVASRFNLSPTAFAEDLLGKAGITVPPYWWTRFECTTWLADRAQARLVEGSFAPEPAPAELNALIERLAPLGIGYLLRHQRADGSFYTRYDPLQDQLYEGIDLPRIAHAAWVLARAKAFDSLAGEAVARTIDFLIGTISETDDGLWPSHSGNEPSVAEIALLLLALCESPATPANAEWGARLANALWARIDRHGCVHTHRDHAAATDAFQDYFPGQVLLALATAARRGILPAEVCRFDRPFRYYRHRFRNRPDFGQVSWMTQACCALWRLKPDPRFAELAFEIVDWILEFQQEKSGAFLNDHQSDTPGYTTTLYLEASAAAASLALLIGDAERHHRYLEACRRGFQFLDGLILQERDASVLPNPARAIGGLRQSARKSAVYIDFVQHYLAAVMEGRGACLESVSRSGLIERVAEVA